MASEGARIVLHEYENRIIKIAEVILLHKNNKSSDELFSSEVGEFLFQAEELICASHACSEVGIQFLYDYLTEFITLFDYVLSQKLQDYTAIVMKLSMTIFSEIEKGDEGYGELMRFFSKHHINPFVCCPYCGHSFDYFEKSRLLSKFGDAKCFMCKNEINRHAPMGAWLIAGYVLAYIVCDRFNISIPVGATVPIIIVMLVLSQIYVYQRFPIVKK